MRDRGGKVGGRSLIEAVSEGAPSVPGKETLVQRAGSAPACGAGDVQRKVDAPLWKFDPASMQVHRDAHAVVQRQDPPSTFAEQPPRTIFSGPLFPPRVVQLLAASAGADFVARLGLAGGDAKHVQAKAGAAEDSSLIHAAATKGISGPAGALPHIEQIQHSFGRHNVGHIQAHIGGPAAAGAQAMGAEAFATGDHVAFASAPSIHTAAHEAAHVVQQRSGVQLAGGVGQTGDTYEQHAHAVADAVARGESAEALLDQHVGSASRSASAIQRKAPTVAVSAGDLGTRGEEQHAGDLTDKQIQDAIAWNDKHWAGAQRKELRTFLARAHADNGEFTAADVHAVRKIQLGAGIEPGKADGLINDTTMAILLNAGFTLSFDGKKAKVEEMQLLFVPGEFEDLAKWQAAVNQAIKDKPSEPYRALVEPSGTGRVYVKIHGNIIDMVNARGGPPVTVRDFGGHTADPTTAGAWGLGTGKSVVTSSWNNSQIPWGAAVRKRTDGEWEFEDPDSHKWKIATGPKSGLTIRLPVSAFEGANDDENQGRNTWRINDFGEMGWRIQGTEGQFVHTTPQDEETTLAGTSPELRASHGCVHLDPAGRDRLRERGYLQPGVKFVVRKYTVHLLPEAMRQIMQGDKPLHDKRTP